MNSSSCAAFSISTVPFVSDDDASSPQVSTSTFACSTCSTLFCGRFISTMPGIIFVWSTLPPSRRTVRMLSTSMRGFAGSGASVYSDAEAMASARIFSWPYCLAQTTGVMAAVTAARSRTSGTFTSASSMSKMRSVIEPSSVS